MKIKSLNKFFSKLRICGSGKLWACIREEERPVPKDIPKGHLAIYVGEECRRYVIHIALLEHPLFLLLLDQAAEAFDFAAPASRLCIPCNENLFLTVLCCANRGRKPHIHRSWLCL
ncbi:hypothetical protein BT93_L4776 [Corymbia citriodora subsp. variegata]|uniref:Small auxin up regulated protein n=1 Tax=Corymbia citriodora subsp. variegata TaxID=360336 RepID=A0A8T0CTM2_CORYI|nr:hypothetical protein BT93_L4776 [Corymbia citriodora subsp. variegata]